MAAALPVIGVVGSLLGSVLPMFMGGNKAPKAPEPAPPPPAPVAPAPEPTVEPEGVQDEAATRARALRRRKETSNQGGLLNLSGVDTKSDSLTNNTLLGS